MKITSIEDRNIYADLMRYFVSKGHHVTIFSPKERREEGVNEDIIGDGFRILRFRTPNIQKTNLVEKAISTYSIDTLLKRAIRKNTKNNRFDLAIYSTPPVTLVNSISFLKKKHDLKTYLLLKDIFPQNAVDIGLMKEGGLVYNYFRKKERKLYELSDFIGCMSQNNVNYVLNNNSILSKKRVEVCPNSVEPENICRNSKEILSLRSKLNIPKRSTVFLYGGNLGKPQGINFLIEILSKFKNSPLAYFVIIGSGTEYSKLERWMNKVNPSNIILKEYMPKSEYNNYIRLCDVGLIFLDHRFTIPNYPSRILSYMEYAKPILCFTDGNSDVGKNALERGYGDWSASNDIDKSKGMIQNYIDLTDDQLSVLGCNGRLYLLNNYRCGNTYDVIMNSFNKKANVK